MKSCVSATKNEREKKRGKEREKEREKKKERKKKRESKRERFLESNRTVFFKSKYTQLLTPRVPSAHSQKEYTI